MTRDYFCDIAVKLGQPILQELAQRRFRATFPDKKPTATMEAFSRILVGLAPWFELGVDEDAIKMSEIARGSIDSATNQESEDFMDFSKPDQSLVEAALMAQALLRAPQELWMKLPAHVKTNTINALKQSRTITPHDNNWVLFPSIIETFFLKINEKDIMYDRLFSGINWFQELYVGDGSYKDGNEFHFDYYNSFIIHPMLFDILEVYQTLKNEFVELKPFAEKQCMRLQRLATLQERLIAPDGTFPPIGRSITYRCGAFHGLALCAYKKLLPHNLKPSQAREGLTRVIRATLDPPNTFEDRWLTKGLYGKQPSLAEPYINHGSLYFCSTALLPLGLPAEDPFWKDESIPNTWDLLKNGHDYERDKPYVECVRSVGRCV